ncbi:MAG: hypothetical protein OSB05_02865 [Akkermansiaceae bacterium]|nr:hypothetical protein [Akkermansiaceae bacterium]
MRTFFVFSLLLVGLASATTLEVLQVYQPISLHGTDMDHEFQGEYIQARIFSSPMVLGGAMPENLVAAVAMPHQMPPVDNYAVKESNLLVLYGIDLYASLDEEIIIVTFDLTKMDAHEHVELPIRTVLELSIAALKHTLSEYHHTENDPMKVRVVIAGTTAKNASLKNLSSKFVIKD